MCVVRTPANAPIHHLRNQLLPRLALRVAHLVALRDCNCIIYMIYDVYYINRIAHDLVAVSASNPVGLSATAASSSSKFRKDRPLISLPC
jgi:hypothetical protein